MLDNETRKLLLEDLDKNHSIKEVAENYSVDVSTVYRLLEQIRRTGSFETRTHFRGRKSVFSEEDIQNIRALVEKQPDITLQKIIDTLKLHVCIETVRKALMKMGYSYKKVYLRTGEQEEGLEPCYIWMRRSAGK